MTATPIFRPILFQPEMVQANMQDRKTMTRRTRGLKSYTDWAFEGVMNLKKGYFGKFNKSGEVAFIKSPYGKPGDFLYVRESFARLPLGLIDKKNNVRFAYNADYNYECLQITTQKLGLQWKPSIHMPKQAARIFLQVTDVNIERLQDISDQHAIAEGVKHVIDKVTGYCGYNYITGGYNLMTSPYHGFKSLWQKINGPKSWDSNPYLWVITYKVISKHGCPEFLKPHFLKPN